MASEHPARVLVAGGGVAGLETLLALQDLAGDRVTTTLLTPERDFVYRPMSVAAPFARGHARRYELADVVRDTGATLRRDRLQQVDDAGRYLAPYLLARDEGGDDAGERPAGQLVEFDLERDLPAAADALRLSELRDAAFRDAVALRRAEDAGERRARELDADSETFIRRERAVEDDLRRQGYLPRDGGEGR